MGNVNTGANDTSSDAAYSSLFNAMQDGFRAWVFCETYLLFPILVVGILGHLWTWFVYGRRWSTWKSTCKVYLLVMSVCDVLAILTYSLPEFLHNSLSYWTKERVSIFDLQINLISCRILRYFLQVSFCGANSMVIAVSLETLIALSMPTAQLSTKRSSIAALSTLLVIILLCIPIPFAYAINPTDLALCVLDISQPLQLYITVVVVEGVLEILPPFILAICNILLIYHAQKLQKEASNNLQQIRVVPTAATKRRATMVMETLGISIWTNVAIAPLSLLVAASFILALNPYVPGWSLQLLYSYNIVLNWSRVALIVSQVTCATNWAVYSYWVKFFWRDSYNYLRCRCNQRRMLEDGERAADGGTRHTAMSEGGRSATATDMRDEHAQFDA